MTSQRPDDPLALRPTKVDLLRVRVPKGGSPEHGRLQVMVDGSWEDVPVTYDDPGDEYIPCPLDAPHITPDRICAVCLGEGYGRRVDIEERTALLAMEDSP